MGTGREDSEALGSEGLGKAGKPHGEVMEGERVPLVPLGSMSIQSE